MHSELPAVQGLPGCGRKPGPSVLDFGSFLPRHQEAETAQRSFRPKRPHYNNTNREALANNKKKAKGKVVNTVEERYQSRVDRITEHVTGSVSCSCTKGCFQKHNKHLSNLLAWIRTFYSLKKVDMDLTVRPACFALLLCFAQCTDDELSCNLLCVS